MRDYEIIEGYFQDVTSLVGGSTLQQELNYIYGYGLELSDFNPNWVTLDALPETSYETHILDTIEQVTIDVYNVELSASGDEYYLYYEITNNSDEDITFMWFKTEYVLITGVIGEDYYFWTGELDNHLGCIPGYNPEEKTFLCACHGGLYDFSGDVTKAPPPRGLDIPPFKVDGNKLVLGEVGPEYKKMKETGITL